METEHDILLMTLSGDNLHSVIRMMIDYGKFEEAFFASSVKTEIEVPCEVVEKPRAIAWQTEE